MLERWTTVNHGVRKMENRSVHLPNKPLRGRSPPWNLHSVRFYQDNVTVSSKEKRNMVPKHEWLGPDCFVAPKIRLSVTLKDNSESSDPTKNRILYLTSGVGIFLKDIADKIVTHPWKQPKWWWFILAQVTRSIYGKLATCESTLKVAVFRRLDNCHFKRTELSTWRLSI